jgi:hypothetical protein
MMKEEKKVGLEIQEKERSDEKVQGEEEKEK